MRILLTVFTLFILAVQLSGQDRINIVYEVAKSKSKEFNDSSKSLDEKQIAGSPYLDKQFQSSYILKINGAEIKDILLRYNIYNNTMEFKKDSEILAVAFPNEIQRINMGGNVFIYARYSASKTVKSGYFQVLYEGNYQLLKKYLVAVNLFPEKIHSGDSLKFERKLPQFYLRYNNGMAHLIYSQKNLIRVLQPISQSVIDYIQSRRINIKNESQLTELMEFIEQTTN